MARFDLQADTPQQLKREGTVSRWHVRGGGRAAKQRVQITSGHETPYTKQTVDKSTINQHDQITHDKQSRHDWEFFVDCSGEPAPRSNRDASNIQALFYIDLTHSARALTCHTRYSMP